MDEKTILLIEDSPDDVVLAKRALSINKIDHEVVIAEDGLAALAYFFDDVNTSGYADRPLPHLILLDLKLPKVDGLEVLKRLRSDQRTRRVPIVVLTTSNEYRDMVNSYDLGANSYIRKPVNFSKFTDVVRQLGEYWLTLNETANT